MTDSSQQSFFLPVEPRVNSDELERGILEYWKDQSIFEKSLEQAKDKEPFIFYDGPPYATGKPHYGHVLQSAIKDTVLRYKTMQGYYVPRRVGWDTHGLPVEVLVEKELGLRTKREVEEYGIEQFNQKCREVVFRYIDEFTATLRRLGRWADYENGYATLDRNYMESEWWVFKQLWDKDLVYKDFRSTPYCVRCATPLSNFETGMGYKDTTDTAVYVEFEVKDDHKSRTDAEASTGLHKQLVLLVWTTTPWTLPGNVAVAFHPEVSYVSVVQGEKEYVVAEKRVAALFGEGAEIAHTWTPEELQRLHYAAPYPTDDVGTNAERLYSVVPAEFVTADDGTGFVHIAPAFGADDFELSRKAQLPVLRTVEPNGLFMTSVPQWGGQHVWKVNKGVVVDLTERNLIFKEEQFTHSYPHCWRCDEPLIYYALDSWFVRVQQLKKDLLAANEKISWIPEHIKEGRFAKGIESAPDWAVSRNRYWSVPIPVWECNSCDARVCIESIAQLQEKAGVGDIPDIHRPYVDAFSWKCEQCEGEMRRVEEVLDVWFDSGSMPFSQWHYPFENKNFVEKGLPADFIAESIEMTRAWFYVMHVLSVAVKGTHAYKNVIGSGIIFGEDGNKLSKKLKNYPEIEPTLEAYGADILRLFFLSSTLGEPYVFAESDLKQLRQRAYMRWWNVYSFFVSYANTHGWTPSRQATSEHVLDRWILARLKQLENEVRKHADVYRIDMAARAFVPFIDDVSNWYVRRSRGRFQRPKNAEEEAAAFTTLYTVLVEASKLLAPYMPFVSEEVFRNLTQAESVHLELLSAELPVLSDEEMELLTQMELVRAIVSEGLSLRAQAGIKVRQPLQTLKVQTETQLPSDLIQMIQEEVNVKSVDAVSKVEAEAGYVVSADEAIHRVALQTELTAELRAEGVGREVIRHGQMLRREAKLALNQRILVEVAVEDSELVSLIEQQKAVIADALQADTFEVGTVLQKQYTNQSKVKIEGHSVTIALQAI